MPDTSMGAGRSPTARAGDRVQVVAHLLLGRIYLRHDEPLPLLPQRGRFC